jgi:hypothetical protein
MEILRKIAEQRIREAINNGMFEKLSGSGRPLVFKDETWIPKDLRIAYRFLKNAGCIPLELERRNEILNLKNLLYTLDDDKERIKEIRELNFKLIQLNMMRKKPFNLEDFPEYENRIQEQLSTYK